MTASTSNHTQPEEQTRRSSIRQKLSNFVHTHTPLHHDARAPRASCDSHDPLDFSTTRRSHGGTRRAQNFEESQQIQTQTLEEFRLELVKRGLQIPNDMVYAGDLDATLMRFLRARKMSVEKATEMMIGTLKWRKDHGVAGILDASRFDPEKSKIIRKYKPSSYIGFNMDGKPIYIDRLGELDANALRISGVTEDDLVDFHVREMEYMGRILMREATRLKGGITVDQIVMIMDVGGVSLFHFTRSAREVFKRQVAIDQDNYPETNGGTFIVNAGAVFSTIWKVLEPFLDKKTRSKIQVLGSGKKMQQILISQFGEEQVPRFLGGRADFETVRSEWADKMEQEIMEYQVTKDDALNSQKENELDAVQEISAAMEDIDLDFPPASAGLSQTSEDQEFQEVAFEMESFHTAHSLFTNASFRSFDKGDSFSESQHSKTNAGSFSEDNGVQNNGQALYVPPKQPWWKKMCPCCFVRNQMIEKQIDLN